MNQKKTNRREFLQTCTVLATAETMIGTSTLWGKETMVGQPLPPWKEGEMDLHFIYTGVGENMYYIFPDGTEMVLDAADRPSNQQDDFPIKPDKSRLPSEWIARYIKRVRPGNGPIEYMMLSHYHSDHAGCEDLHAGKTTGRGDDYYLSGLAHLGELFSFHRAYDRHSPLASGHDAYENYNRFIQWKVKNREIIREKFRVGALDQISLVKDPKKYPNFHIRNLCGNVEVWTGKDEKTTDYRTLYPKNGLNENYFSLGFRIEYGPFRYYTGGDVSGRILDDNKKDVHFEGAIGRAAGPVDVCKANHHSYLDAMTPEFVREVQAKVYIINVWDFWHLNDKTMTTMTDTRLYPGERMVCHTWVAPKQLEKNQNKSWLSSLKPANGHIVVRVSPGGEQYTIYYLTADDESMKIKAVFGPFTSGKKG